MTEIETCRDMDDVRRNIDRIDGEIVALLAERGAYVAQAAQFKANEQEVEAPKRVEAVIAKVRARAVESDANPDIVEAVYRTMIREFIAAEKRAHMSL